jgi:hypothetical protein
MSSVRFPILVTIVILLLLLLGVATCQPSSGVPAAAQIAQPALDAVCNLPPLEHVSEFDNRTARVYTGF